MRLDQFAFILTSSSALLTAGMRTLLEELAKAKAISWLRDQLHPDVEKLQDELFGLHDGHFGIIRGSNEWRSTSDPNRYFGEQSLESDRVPPYDYEGIARLQGLYREKYHPVVRGAAEIIDDCRDILVIGGGRINPEMHRIKEEYGDLLPFQFVDRTQVVPNFVPASRPRKFRRIYTKEPGDQYEKVSHRGSYLVSVREPDRPPFGPFLDDEGRLTTDVIQLTIVPGKRHRRLILVRPGHGAGIRLADVLANGHFLDQMASEIRGDQPHPFLQAVFTVPVEQDDSTEEYGTPKLVDVEPLGIT